MTEPVKDQGEPGLPPTAGSAAPVAAAALPNAGPTTTAATPDAAVPDAAPTAATATPDAAAPDAAANESIVSPIAPAAVTETAPPASAQEAPATSARRVRLRLLGGLARLAQFIVMLAIFVAGIALGYARFQAIQPAASTAGAPVTTGVEAPSSVQGLAQALGRNDLEAARSSVPPIRDAQGQVVGDPYGLLAGELRAMQMLEVRKVQTLSTFADGPRTATAMIISGRTTQGADISRHLIVQTINGTIVSFT